MCRQAPYKPVGDCRQCGEYVEICPVVAAALDCTIDPELHAIKSAAGKSARIAGHWRRKGSKRPTVKVNAYGIRLCAWDGCEKVRSINTPYCLEHRRQKLREYQQRRARENGIPERKFKDASIGD